MATNRTEAKIPAAALPAIRRALDAIERGHLSRSSFLISKVTHRPSRAVLRKMLKEEQAISLITGRWPVLARECCDIAAEVAAIISAKPHASAHDVAQQWRADTHDAIVTHAARGETYAATVGAR